MRQPEARHYTEEELMMHLLEEETHEIGSMISAHLLKCNECSAITQEFRELEKCVHSWIVDELPEESWQSRKTQLLELFRQDQSLLHGKGVIHSVLRAVQMVWDYAVENPLPTMAYIAAAVAFASERAITVFRLNRILPETTQVIQILRQVL